MFPRPLSTNALGSFSDGGLVKGVCVCVCEEIKNLTSVTWPKKARDINWAEGIQKDLDALPFELRLL